MNLKDRFISQLETDFPELKQEKLDTLVSENLISPFQIELDSSIRVQIQDFISSAYALRQRPEYLQEHAAALEAQGIRDPGNKSILMSYDFHVDSDQQIKLIEINTNASFLLLGLEMYRMWKHELPVADFGTDKIKAMILEELRLQNKNLPSPQICTIDETPEEQRLYIEFLAYDQLFKSWGWSSSVRDYRQALQSPRPDFIYNRHTDFMLAEPDAQDLRKAFLDQSVCFSPNPFEYFMLADKQRLIEWTRPGYLERMGLEESQVQSLRRGLPVSLDLTPETSETLWKQRKNYFMKPKRAFGSKQSYRGSSISRKTFDELIGQDIVAQEYVPAPEVHLSLPQKENEEHTFKYDLRCYAYQGKLQMIVARLYQGQVTNLRTPLGGFACVKVT